MKNYIKPMILSNEELAEGIFAGSGNCYTFTARITQLPALGHEVYTIQMDGVHAAKNNHHSTERTVLISFNQPVTYVSSNASAYEGDGTNSLSLTFTDGNDSPYHNNGTDTIGLGQLVVQSNDGLAITGTKCTYCNNDCGKH